MREMELILQMKDIGYRVVPDLIPYQGKFEIIVEPWHWDLQERRSGRTRRTGIFFNKADCYLSGAKETPFAKRLREVQEHLIQHILKTKRKVV